MTRVVISQPMYFPWVGFLAQLALADVLIWLDDVQFSKGSFTNRVQVPKGPDGTGWLSIPLAGKGSGRKIADLAPDRPDWTESHRATLRNAYGRSADWNEIDACLAEVAATSPLPPAIAASSETLARAVGLDLPAAMWSSDMDVPGAGSARVLSLVQAAGGTRYITGHGARNYLDHAAFEAAGVAVDYMDYAPRPWPQSSASFTPYVTGLDLVAHVPAPDRRGHLNPRTTPWREVVEQD